MAKAHSAQQASDGNAVFDGFAYTYRPTLVKRDDLLLRSRPRSLDYILNNRRAYIINLEACARPFYNIYYYAQTCCLALPPRLTMTMLLWPIAMQAPEPNRLLRECGMHGVPCGNVHCLGRHAHLKPAPFSTVKPVHTFAIETDNTPLVTDSNGVYSSEDLGLLWEHAPKLLVEVSGCQSPWIQGSSRRAIA